MSTDADVIQAQLKAMTETLLHVRATVDAMNVELKKISVLEEKHSNHSQALSRAFTEIEKLEEALLDHQRLDQEDHDDFKKTIWFTSGFAVAVSVLWTVFGIYLSDAVKDTMKGVAEMRAHTADRAVHVPPPIGK